MRPCGEAERYTKNAAGASGRRRSFSQILRRASVNTLLRPRCHPEAGEARPKDLKMRYIC